MFRDYRVEFHYYTMIYKYICTHKLTDNTTILLEISKFMHIDNASLARRKEIIAFMNDPYFDRTTTKFNGDLGVLQVIEENYLIEDPTYFKETKQHIYDPVVLSDMLHAVRIASAISTIDQEYQKSLPNNKNQDLDASKMTQRQIGWYLVLRKFMKQIIQQTLAEYPDEYINLNSKLNEHDILCMELNESDINIYQDPKLIASFHKINQ